MSSRERVAVLIVFAVTVIGTTLVFGRFAPMHAGARGRPEAVSVVQKDAR